MNNQPAFNELTNTYDLETMQEIVNHGCVSGVCSQHIYYGDTISFFDKYEDEILSLIEERYDTDTLVELFQEANANLDHYKNNVVWLFIENVAVDVVTEMEELEYSENLMITDYMKPIQPKDSVNFYTSKDGELMERTGYNPPQSMTMNRYSQV